jgi:hypothetical protein
MFTCGYFSLSGDRNDKEQRLLIFSYDKKRRAEAEEMVQYRLKNKLNWDKDG